MQSLENVRRRALQIIVVYVICRLVQFKCRHYVTGVVNCVFVYTNST